ncbi:hypothetical protein S245_063562, partial [Arachis hypogaea]
NMWILLNRVLILKMLSCTQKEQWVFTKDSSGIFEKAICANFDPMAMLPFASYV